MNTEGVKGIEEKPKQSSSAQHYALFEDKSPYAGTSIPKVRIDYGQSNVSSSLRCTFYLVSCYCDPYNPTCRSPGKHSCKNSSHPCLCSPASHIYSSAVDFALSGSSGFLALEVEVVVALLEGRLLGLDERSADIQ